MTASSRKLREPRPLAERIIAIEAKLSDWRRALYQASRYLDYASQSWVVLDWKALSSALLHVYEFQHRGIGLAGVSPIRSRRTRDVVSEPAKID